MSVTIADLGRNLSNNEHLLFLIQQAEKEGMSFDSPEGAKFVRYAVEEDLALSEAFRAFAAKQSQTSY